MILGDATAVPVGWLAALILCVVSTTVFLFSTFKTKEDAEADKKALQAHIDRIDDTLHERLDRMENKIDRILEQH